MVISLKEVAALRTTKTTQTGKYHAKKLRSWARAFIDDRNELPENNWGNESKSAIDDDDLAQDIHLHLQCLERPITAEDVVKFCGTEYMLARLRRTKTIQVMTAR